MRSSLVFVIAAGAGLAACTDVEKTYSPSDPVVQIDSFYAAGASDRDLQLVVFGDPFAIPQDQFAKVIETALRDAPNPHAPTRPLLAPGPTAKPIYRLVYVFNPSSGLFGNAICEHAMKPELNTDYPPAAPGPAVPGAEVRAVAAFCVEYRAVTEISGDTQASGPDDPRLFRLTRDMMAEVFRPDIHPHTGNPAGNAAAPRI